jgi:NADPH2 dehydrogenase
MDNAPGLFTQEQLKAWKQVTDGVHEAGSYIYCQLWALGRAAVPGVLAKKGLDFVSSSATPIDEKSPNPRELRDDEIQAFIKAYADAARNAVEIGGFDGVEIHAANGYLIDQFSQDTCNKRADRWGGSIENRTRFGLEVAKAVVNAVGASKVGIRLSPYSTFQGMRMADPLPTFDYLVKGLKDLKLSYLHLVESRVHGTLDKEQTEDLDSIIKLWDISPVLLAGAYEADTAVERVDKDYPSKDIAICFGRHFISTPDIAFRIQTGIPFNKYNRKTFYRKESAEGYIDYPFSDQWKRFSAML